MRISFYAEPEVPLFGHFCNQHGRTQDIPELGSHITFEGKTYKVGSIVRNYVRQSENRVVYLDDVEVSIDFMYDN